MDESVWHKIADGSRLDLHQQISLFAKLKLTKCVDRAWAAIAPGRFVAPHPGAS
jgi:hypothetical protein